MPLTMEAENMAVGRQTWHWSNSLHVETTTMRQREKLIRKDDLPLPTRLHLLILNKKFHQLGTEYLNMSLWGLFLL